MADVAKMDNRGRHLPAVRKQLPDDGEDAGSDDAAGDARAARTTMSISGLVANAAADRQHAERGGADRSSLR